MAARRSSRVRQPTERSAEYLADRRPSVSTTTTNSKPAVSATTSTASHKRKSSADHSYHSNEFESSSTSSTTTTTSKSTSKSSVPRRFKLIRTLALADFITLANCACGTLSILACLNFLENQHAQWNYLYFAQVLLVAALLFDIADGSVARWRRSSSPYGADLDSLADIISFSVAPAVIAFAIGMRGFYDQLVLCFFVSCGVARLARFNVTSEALTNAATKKVYYFEGFPVPSSLLLVMLFSFATYVDAIFDHLWLGVFKLPIIGGNFHPIVITYLIIGALQISTVRIPKP